MNKEEELTILLNKIGRCEYMIRLLNKEIIRTMKRPILTYTNEGIEYKWNNKIIAIKQKRKGIKRYSKLKSPYDTLKYGVGYIGCGEYKSKDKNGNKTSAYNHWSNMIMRCYNEKFKQSKPTYEECICCEEWLNFQNFAEWHYNNYYKIDGKVICLDKDILNKKNKMYSPNTCIYAPININSLFTKSNATRGALPIGVVYHKRDKIYEVSCRVNNKDKYLGRYSNKMEAFNIYKNEKERYIKEVADRYKEYIPNKLYEAMYNYEVEIND